MQSILHFSFWSKTEETCIPHPVKYNYVYYRHGMCVFDQLTTIFCPPSHALYLTSISIFNLISYLRIRFLFTFHSPHFLSVLPLAHLPSSHTHTHLNLLLRLYPSPPPPEHTHTHFSQTYRNLNAPTPLSRYSSDHYSSPALPLSIASR